MKPMLAKKYDGQDPTGWLMSEKLDGVRAIWTGEKLISRTGKPFCAPAWFVEGLPKDVVLDGELWEGRGLFQQTCGKVRTKNNPNWDGIRYILFDCIAAGTFTARYKKLYQLELPEHAEMLRQIVCSSKKHMLDLERQILNEGGEGIMLKRALSLYQYKRSGDILKVKRFQTDEAIVDGYEAGQGRHEGRIGALLCKFRNKMISIGTGLTDSERENPPEKGDLITFRYFELTESGMPRFPVFVAPRDYE